MSPGDLHEMLSRLKHDSDPRVLVDMSTSDDAGVIALDPRRALVLTIDVITPIVDDPRSYGRIAAANSVSDVYAMGGQPTSAVALLSVPKELPKKAVAPIMEGAQQILDQAKAPLLGGHTLKDKELKLGFAVTGVVDPKRMTTVDGAKAGQKLVLSKPLGTGVLFQAMKAGVRTKKETGALVRSMTTLNDKARDRMVEAGVRGATDVTGFGLIGHALNIAKASKVDIVLEAERLPVLPGVLGYLEKEIYPGATNGNLEGYGKSFVRGPGVSDVFVRLAADPQTSGGMLMAIDPKKAEKLAEAVGGWIVGETRAPRGRAPRVTLA